MLRSERWSARARGGAVLSLLTYVVLVASATLAQGAEPTPGAARYLEFWRDNFEGEWATTIVAGEPAGRDAVGIVGSLSYRLAPTKTSILFRATANGKPDFTGLGGYDPKSRTWKEVFFMVDGSHLVQSYTASETDLIGDPVGKTIKGKAEYVYADGRVETAEIAFTFTAPDRYEYSATKRRVGDEVHPDYKVVAERTKR